MNRHTATFGVLLLLALPFVSNAQTSRGTVTGIVLDPSGTAIAGAQLRLTGVETRAQLSTQSNETGVYRFDAVDLGAYELQVTHPGFKTFLVTGINVAANRVTTFDPKLDLGTAETRVEVSSEASDILIKDSPLRGGNFRPHEVRDLPLTSLNPLSLTRTLPGATESSGSVVYGGGTDGLNSNNGGGFAINGQRPRGNNYLLDGVENNEIWMSGEEQVFHIADAVEEVSVQTGNFGVEFGRAGGGVFNVITKSGTNNLHGSLLWRYQSHRFNSISNATRLKGLPQSVFSNNVYGFTAGGPLRKDRTFFFTGFQENQKHSTGNYAITAVPTSDAVARLRSLFPNNPRLDLYLNALGDLRGIGGLVTSLALGADPQTGVNRGPVTFATGDYVLPSRNDSPEWFGRIDHYQSEKHRLSFRYAYDSRINLPGGGNNGPMFPGFYVVDTYSHHNALFSDSYTFGPAYTNELRFSYGRPEGNFQKPWSGAGPAALAMPKIVIPNVSSPGFGTNGQFHHGNNFLLQETQTKLVRGHALRYGVEFLRQTIEQGVPLNTAGTLNFAAANSIGYSAFANFLDDFSGPSVSNNSRIFGASVFHPNQVHQSYFFQDEWKATPALALTMGLRYDNFGQPANSLKYPAFSGFDPDRFLVRQEAKADNHDFGPAFGLAWSPAARSNTLSKIFGDGKTVWRGGFQISYDVNSSQLLAMGPATSTPNAIKTVSPPALATGRGSPGWYERLPPAASTASLMDARDAIDPNMRHPYTERWSFGFQRQLRQVLLLDVSYVGSESHRLTTRADWNPQANGVRLYPNFGPTTLHTSEGNSSYHSLQARLDRRFSNGMQFAASYTWSKSIDSTSDGDAGGTNQDPLTNNGNITSVPVMQGGMKLDRGVSAFDRAHRLTVSYLWNIPEPRANWLRPALGGWVLGGITTLQSGTPFTVGNGGASSDRNGDGIFEDRPDIGNVKAPLNTRAILYPACATGYQNPDTGACVGPGDVHWVEGRGFPNGATVGRNTLRTGGTNNFDLNLTKAIRLGETRHLELRWEALNAFNRPQYVQVPQRSVNGTPAGQFLNRDLTDSGIRSMWVQMKLVF
jgi:hypothetical protein